VLFGIDAHGETGLVHELLANANVTLLDKDAGVVYRLSEALLEHLGLKAAFQNLLCGKKENGIELLLLVSEEAEALKLAEKGGTFENALGVLDVKSHQLTSSLAYASENKLGSPDFLLASKTKLTDELEFLVEALLFVGASGHSHRFGVVAVTGVLGHGEAYSCVQEGPCGPCQASAW